MDLERLNRAIGLGNAGRLEESLREFRELEAISPNPDDRASIVLNESACFMRMGDFAQARDSARRAAVISPTPFIRCNAVLADAAALTHTGKNEEALRELSRALHDFQDVLGRDDCRYLYEDIQVRRGFLLAELERFKESSLVLEECLSFSLSQQDRGCVLYNLARSCTRLGETERAKALFAQTIEHGVPIEYVASAHFELGATCYKEDAFAKAALEFEWCLARADDFGMSKLLLYGWLAKTHEMLGNKTEARRYEALARQSKQ